MLGLVPSLPFESFMEVHLMMAYVLQAKVPMQTYAIALGVSEEQAKKLVDAATAAGRSLLTNNLKQRGREIPF